MVLDALGIEFGVGCRNTDRQQERDDRLMSLQTRLGKFSTLIRKQHPAARLDFHQAIPLQALKRFRHRRLRDGKRLDEIDRSNSIGGLAFQPINQLDVVLGHLASMVLPGSGKSVGSPAHRAILLNPIAKAI